MTVNGDDLEAALRDPEASAARRDLARSVSAVLSEAGSLLFLGGHLIGPNRVSGASPFGHGNDKEVGLAMTMQIAAELAVASAMLIEVDHLYAAAALVRQVVETEYLLWAFGSQQAEAEAWLRSSSEERRRMWQPRHLRKKSGGKFGAADYRSHCDRGGHPTPEARSLLIGHSVRVSADVMWLELTLHAVACWDHAAAAIAGLESLEVYGKELLSRQVMRDFSRARAIWTAVERVPQLASGFDLSQVKAAGPGP